MITSINVLYSQKSDLLSIKQRFNYHPPRQTLIQVFSGCIQKTEVERLLDDLKDVFPQTPIIGATTAGEIINGQIKVNTIVVNISFFESTIVNTTLVAQYDNLRLAGQTLAGDLIASTPQAVIVFGCSIKDGYKIDATPMLAALSEILPQAIVAGGQAGDNGNGVISYVFNEDGIVSYGAAAASLSGENLSVQNNYSLSWIPIGKKLTITNVSGSRVYSIDDRTPLNLYRHYLGTEVVEGLPLAAADFPLVIERDGIPMAIHALGVNDDGSFDYIHSFHSGEQVQFGFCHSGLLGDSAKKIFDELRQHPTQAAFIYSCVSRKWILGQDINVEIAPIATLAPTAGFFAYGEYFTHPKKQCLLFSQTMTVLTLAELNENETPILAKELEPIVTEEESKQLKTLKVLHRLVETSAKEIEVINQQLSEMALQDSLTKLPNRRSFDRQFATEFKRARRNATPLSLVLIDVDDFKHYNDTYGHVEGDCCLRSVASVLKKVPQRPGDLVARYGGEEFICILSNTDFAGAMYVAEKIRHSIYQLSIPHESSTVSDRITVSIGVQTVDRIVDRITPKDLIVLCDRQLYNAKGNGRNRVSGKRIN